MYFDLIVIYNSQRQTCAEKRSVHANNTVCHQHCWLLPFPRPYLVLLIALPPQDGIGSASNVDDGVAGVCGGDGKDGQVVGGDGHAGQGAATPVAAAGWDVRVARSARDVLAVPAPESAPQNRYSGALPARAFDTVHVAVLLPSDARAVVGAVFLLVPLHPERMAAEHFGGRAADVGDGAVRGEHLGYPDAVHFLRARHCRVDPVWRRPLFDPVHRRRLFVAVPPETGAPFLGARFWVHEPDRRAHPDPLPVRRAVV